MKLQVPILVLLILATLPLRAPELAALPEPGPQDGGLRMRLVVVPRTDAANEGYAVRVELINTSERMITLRSGWQNEKMGDLKDYLEAATSIECVPAVRRWIGGVKEGQRKSPQPEHLLEPGAVLSVSWRTQG